MINSELYDKLYIVCVKTADLLKTFFIVYYYYVCFLFFFFNA